MYLSIPDAFFVPIYYGEEDVFNIKEIVILQQVNFNSKFTNKSTERKNMKIGVSLPTQREEIWVKHGDIMENYAKAKGVDVKVQVADTDIAKQEAQVDELIAQGIDVLILAPTDSEAAADLVDKAHKAGIKVISYERLIKNSDVDLYIAFDSERVGELQGKFLTEKVPKGKYIVLSGDPEDNNAKLLKDGALKYIKPLVNKGDIKIVAEQAVVNWEPKNAFNIVRDSLIANKNKIDAILAPNDAIAGAAIEALTSSGLDGKVQVTGQNSQLAGKVSITGQDSELAAAQRIVKGTQAMTVFKDSRELGKKAIDAAIKLANREGVDVNARINNGKIDVPSILITPILVNKDNIDRILIESGYLNKKEVYNE